MSSILNNSFFVKVFYDNFKCTNIKLFTHIMNFSSNSDEISLCNKVITDDNLSKDNISKKFLGYLSSGLSYDDSVKKINKEIIKIMKGIIKPFFQKLDKMPLISVAMNKKLFKEVEEIFEVDVAESDMKEGFELELNESNSKYLILLVICIIIYLRK
jgi:hypothetical protein